ncbi:MAG: adenylyltransferase/cytidyltransferase family protein [Candidatus Bilamarchaeum sp.]
MKEKIMKLLTLQLRHRGITPLIYSHLSEDEKKLLEKSGDLYYLKKDERSKIKVVLTGGVFDVIHIGHIFTLNDAKKHGDFLVVAIANDDHIRKKGREPIHNQEYRTIIIDSLKVVDVAIAGFPNPKEMIEFVRPNVIVYGYDQKEFLKPEGVKIIKLERKIDDTKFKSGKILEQLGV